MNLREISDHIKEKALQLGFHACGICEATFTGQQALFLKEWLDKGFHGEMSYLGNHYEKRTDPGLLVENARSVIVVALNYYPGVKQKTDVPQFAYYAYGRDYHLVVKDKLKQLYRQINEEIIPMKGRMFCDTAPILEKYHAQKAGLGWIGKHTQLIVPGCGSYFFLGEIVVDIELAYDTPLRNNCGNCTQCMDACPTKALVAPSCLDARKCLAYLSIEFKGQLPEEENLPGFQVYGCDICNKACPHNKFAQKTEVHEFEPSEQFMGLTYDQIEQMDEESFKNIFNHSAVKRIGLQQLKRNLSKI